MGWGRTLESLFRCCAAPASGGGDETTGRRCSGVGGRPAGKRAGGSGKRYFSSHGKPPNRQRQGRHAAGTLGRSPDTARGHPSNTRGYFVRTW